MLMSYEIAVGDWARGNLEKNVVAGDLESASGKENVHSDREISSLVSILMYVFNVVGPPVTFCNTTSYTTNAIRSLPLA